MKKKLTAISALLLGCSAVVVTAQAAENQWRVNLGAGYQVFDSDRMLDDTGVGMLGFEKELSDEWGVELKIMGSSTEPDIAGLTNVDVDVYQGSLDLLRYFGSGNWQPYLSVGLGHGDFKVETPAGDFTSGETQASLGGGVRYDFDNSWSARFDLRAINGLDVEQTDGVATLGIGYAFGGKDSKPEPAPEPMRPKEKDTDGDGVSDTMDRCANTPVGVVVNASGCPLDTDGDGVPDYKDKCPQTPAGRQVDETGCKFVLSRTEQIRMEVNFATNSADIPAQYMAEIEKVASFLKKYGGVSAVIEGHTDSTGADAYNKTLSQRRADSVKAALVTKYGINASRLTAIGYGEERPVASNETREGRAENRRVVAVLKAEVTE